MKKPPLKLTTIPETLGPPSAEEIAELHEGLCRAWETGSGEAFAAGFTPDAHFVAFDGTILRGSEAIARFHQLAFDTHLKGTRLKVNIEETRALGSSASLAFTSGRIERDGASQGDLIGGSVQTAVLVRKEGKVLIEAFQNTRARPITGEGSAGVWKAFDRAWNEQAL